MNYTEAIDKLNGRTSRKIDNNTYLELNDDKSIGVRLHDTQVVVYHPEFAELFTGGWLTPTTKDRINGYGLNYPSFISQKNSIWYMSDGSLFYEGIKVNYDGKILKPKKPIAHEKETKKVKANIKKYAESVVKTLETGKLGVPNGGDCWHCALTTTDNKTLGDATKNYEHLINHIKEGYIVPSLVWNAVKEAGYAYPEVIIGYSKENAFANASYSHSEGVQRSVVKYLQKRLIKQ